MYLLSPFLERRRIYKASKFKSCTGTLYNCIYSQAAQLKATMAAGHQIGSHTWDHQNLGSKSAADVKAEMTKLETAFANILGVKSTYMRPPSGDSGGQTVSVMQQLGYRIVKWDIDSEDWNKKTPAQSEAKFTAAGSGSHIPCTPFLSRRLCPLRGLGAVSGARAIICGLLNQLPSTGSASSN